MIGATQVYERMTLRIVPASGRLFIYTRQEISITARGSSLLPRQNVKHILKFYIPLLRVVKS